MTIHQRTGSISVDDADKYTLDMWEMYEHTSAGVVAVSQDTDVPTSADAGTARSVFGNSLQVDCSTADTSIAAGDYAYFDTKIEAQFALDFGYGAASAKASTLSFWKKTNLTGQWSLSIYQQDGNRYYTANYTVAGTGWEYHTITIPGDASGTINNDNGPGIRVRWHLVTGSTNQGSADAWTAGNKLGVSGDVNFFSSTSNVLNITGVQYELGSVATSFDFRAPGQALTECRRYYQRVDGAYPMPWTVVVENTTSGYAYCRLQSQMRAAPTITVNAGSDTVYSNAGNRFSSYGTPYVYGPDAWYQGFVLSGSVGGYAGRWRVESGGSYIWSAEL